MPTHIRLCGDTTRLWRRRQWLHERIIVPQYFPRPIRRFDSSGQQQPCCNGCHGPCYSRRPEHGRFRRWSRSWYSADQLESICRTIPGRVEWNAPGGRLGLGNFVDRLESSAVVCGDGRSRTVVHCFIGCFHWTCDCCHSAKSKSGLAPLRAVLIGNVFATPGSVPAYALHGGIGL